MLQIRAARDLLVTRQAHCSTLWSVQDESTPPTPVHRVGDDACCVDVNPFIRSEWCQVDRNRLTVWRHRSGRMNECVD